MTVARIAPATSIDVRLEQLQRHTLPMANSSSLTLEQHFVHSSSYIPASGSKSGSNSCSVGLKKRMTVARVASATSIDVRLEQLPITRLHVPSWLDIQSLTLELDML